VRSCRSAGIGLVAALALATILIAPVSAAEATLRIDPPSIAVGPGSLFSVRVVQEPPVATSGAQVSLTFDPKILQVVAVTRGDAYASSPIFVPQDLDADIRAANASGHLAQVAAAFTPPDAVPAGAATFLLIRFRAVACGQTDLSLPTGGPFNAQMISGEGHGYGAPIVVVTAGGHVTTCAAPGAVTANVVDPVVNDPGAASAGGGPLPSLPLLGAAALFGVGLLVTLARQVRRRSPSDHVAG